MVPVTSHGSIVASSNPPFSTRLTVSTGGLAVVVVASAEVAEVSKVESAADDVTAVSNVVVAAVSSEVGPTVVESSVETEASSDTEVESVTEDSTLVEDSITVVVS